MIDKFIVMTAAAHMPSSCRFGRYGKVAVVETDGVHRPKQIHPKHKAVVNIVAVWDRQNIGHTKKCAYSRACTKARELAAKLNAESEGKLSGYSPCS